MRHWLGLLAVVLVAGCGPNPGAEASYPTRQNPPGTLGLVRHPGPADYSGIHPGGLSSLPVYHPELGDNWQVDLRSTSLTGLAVADRLADLVHADFDSQTRWPPALPPGFDPAAVLEKGKNPGLGLRALHQRGVTGRGVGLAIIDQGLLVDHQEYRDRIKLYEEIHCGDEHSSMHGPAVASIAVGRTVGVAPEADLYFIAETHGRFEGDQFRWDLTWLARSIDRIVEVNRTLPQAGKIRVISISLGIAASLPGADKVQAAVARARKEGIYTVSVESDPFIGLGRPSSADPELPASYGPGDFLKASFASGSVPGPSLWIPMDSRTTASPTGTSDYVFYSSGGMSWTVPYVAGLYALACQIQPQVTPEEFWKAALETGDTVKIEAGGVLRSLGPIVNPTRLMARLAP